MEYWGDELAVALTCVAPRSELKCLLPKMMSINLVKGGNTSLQGLSNVIVGLGWDPSDDVSGVPFDLDAAALMVGANDKLQNAKDFVFFHNLTSPCGSVVHLGDSRSGEGDGDDEQIQVNLATLPPNIAKIVFAVQIYDAEKYKLNFGQVNNSFVRVVDMATGNEVCSAFCVLSLRLLSLALGTNFISSSFRIRITRGFQYCRFRCHR